MAEHELTVVMTYDISMTRIRRKVSNVLEERLCRVQQSVFEGRLKQSAANALFQHAASYLDVTDSLRMYVLTRTGLEKSRASGGAPFPEEEGFWLL